MSIIDTLITDRQKGNINAIAALNGIPWGDMDASQQNEWAADSKGAYNASDLNRVGDACAYIYAIFQVNGYNVPGYTTPKTDWAETDIVTGAQLDAYYGNIAALKERLHAVQAIPPSARRLTVDGANQIEKLLIAVDGLLTRMMQIFIYCGQPHCGQIWGEF